jgi:hypothetical protein
MKLPVAHKFRSLTQLFILSALFSVVAKADYGWMPSYESMYLSLGANYYKTNQNFTDSGLTQNIFYNNIPVQLNEYKIWVESEYGFAQDWSGRIRLNFFGGSVDSISGLGTGYLTGGGITDILAGVKWRVYRGLPTVTLETTVLVPTYSNILNNTTTLLGGNGNIDISFAAHVGYHRDFFLLSASPEFVFRSGGFAQAFDFKTAVGVRFSPVYFYLTTDLFLSMGTNLLYDPSALVHNAAGTGGSYALLSGSPNWFSIGGKGGIEMVKDLFLESTVEQALWGVRAANFFAVGVNLLLKLDFFQPDTRQKIKPVPFESEDPLTDPDGNPS